MTFPRPTRWSAGIGALTLVAATAGSEAPRYSPGSDAAQYAQCRKEAREVIAAIPPPQASQAVKVNIVILWDCRSPDGAIVDPKLWQLPAPARPPAPTRLITAGWAPCVTGSGRPVISTALTSVSATARASEPVLFELQPLAGGQIDDIGTGTNLLEFQPGDLDPGVSYRWRARVDDIDRPDPPPFQDENEPNWSPWCEFTVSADAIDYSGLGNAGLDALNELGVRPDRSYTITLTGRQQRLLRTGTEIGRTSSRMTLTGARWTSLLEELTEWAFGEDDVGQPDGDDYRALVDAISAELGGPRHPELN